MCTDCEGFAARRPSAMLAPEFQKEGKGLRIKVSRLFQPVHLGVAEPDIGAVRDALCLPRHVIPDAARGGADLRVRFRLGLMYLIVPERLLLHLFETGEAEVVPKIIE